MKRKRIVVLGGGFAGVECIKHLQRALRSNSTTEIVMISQDNFLLFRPMLPQVAAGTIKTRNALMPIRAILKKTRFYEARVKDIDPVARRVSVWGTPERHGFAVDYDYLVIALGSDTNFHGMADVEKHAFRMKTLYDAVAVRNRAIDMLEQAENETRESVKRGLLTFVVVGGGFSGVETAGEMHDLLVDAAKHYRNVTAEMISVVILERQPRIMPGFSDSLAEFTHTALVRRGIDIRLETQVDSFDGREARVSRGVQSHTIHTRTMIWTAGLTPANTIRRSVFDMDGGRIKVDGNLEAVGYPGVFVIGDCALLPDPQTGRPYPPSGQLSAAQGKSVAANLNATINGRPKKRFVYRPRGQMAVIGKRAGVASIFGLNIQGILAWMLWRGIFLSKVPIPSKRISIALDWLEDMIFDRDIARLKYVKRERMTEWRDIDEIDETW